MALLKRCFVPFLLVTVAVCQPPPPQPAEAINFDCFDALHISLRPNSLRVLNIQDQREDHEYVFLSRHHIIPFATMRDFYNNLLMRDLRAFQRLFHDVIYVAAEHVGLILTTGVLNVQDYYLPGLAELAGNHLQIRNINQIQLIQEAYAWLPFNIYIGPRPADREDDAQANAFDNTARPLVGDPRYNVLMHLYDDIVRYNLNPNAVRVDTIIATMGDLVHLQLMPYEFIPSQWRVRQGINEYRFVIATDVVTNDPTYRELRPEDYCNTDGQAAYDRYRDRHDLMKRAIDSRPTTKCIMRNANNDAFCSNSLNNLRSAIKSGKLILESATNTVTAANNNSISTKDKDSGPLDTRPQLTPTGWFVHIISLGSWP